MNHDDYTAAVGETLTRAKAEAFVRRYIGEVAATADALAHRLRRIPAFSEVEAHVYSVEQYLSHSYLRTPGLNGIQAGYVAYRAPRGNIDLILVNVVWDTEAIRTIPPHGLVLRDEDCR